MENNNQGKLRKAIIAILVLLILVAVALGVSYLYRHMKDADNSKTSVPQSLISEQQTDEDNQNNTNDNNLSEKAGLENKDGGFDIHQNNNESADDNSAVTDGDATSNIQEAPYLELDKNNTYFNQKFQVRNMLPGDKVTEFFAVNVYHDKDVQLFFVSDVTEETKNLSNVLKLRVTELVSEKVLFDDTFSHINGKEFAQIIEASSDGESRLYYKAEAYLDTSVGNEYQGALLNADFKWYIKDDGKSALTAKTGDNINLILWWTLGILAVTLAVLLILGRKKESSNNSNKKIYTRIGVIAVLSLMLAATTYALISSVVTITDNSFQTGRIKIDLNGGKPVFATAKGSHLNIEPGQTIKSDFYIENEGSADAWYRLYLQDVTGELSDILIFTISDENGNILYSGKASDIDKSKPFTDDNPLTPGEIRFFTMTVKMPESAGNEYQNEDLSFDITADAVQVRNNEGKEFE